VEPEGIYGFVIQKLKKTWKMLVVGEKTKKT
jgi:hypothetical protein